MVDITPGCSLVKGMTVRKGEDHMVHIHEKGWVFWGILIILLVTAVVILSPNLADSAKVASYSGKTGEKEPRELFVDPTGTWSGGGGVGFLGATPDDTAFAINANADYFMSENVSVGPLMQLGVTNDLAQVGLSGQGKYWIDVPGSEGRDKIVLQSGLGFAYADHIGSDTSWLIPLGLGYDRKLESGRHLTMNFLLNFTDLATGRGSSADVMPGFTVGTRF